MRDILPELAPLRSGDRAVEPQPTRVEPRVGGIKDRDWLLAGLPRRRVRVLCGLSPAVGGLSSGCHNAVLLAHRSGRQAKRETGTVARRAATPDAASHEVD